MIENVRMTLSPIELQDEVIQRMHTNRRKGLDFAWPNMNEFASLKKGYPIFMAGVGGVGKTEILLDIMINASIMHKWVWLVLSPEMGTAEEILEQIIEKMGGGEELDVKSDNPMNQQKVEKIIKWANKHFRILDPLRNWKENMSDMALNIENFFQMAKREEEILKGKFDGVVIDPFNELDIDLGGSKTMATVKNELDALLWWTKKNNYCTILTNHVNDKQEVRDKDDEGHFFWTPPAKKEEWAYGQQFGRKGYQMILVYNPHVRKQLAYAQNGDVEMEHSVQNYNNVREILVQKTKPKGVGKTGMFRLFYDRKVHRYYSLEMDGENYIKKGLLIPKI
jgi:hypothetical protein